MSYWDELLDELNGPEDEDDAVSVVFTSTVAEPWTSAGTFRIQKSRRLVFGAANGDVDLRLVGRAFPIPTQGVCIGELDGVERDGVWNRVENCMFVQVDYKKTGRPNRNQMDYTAEEIIVSYSDSMAIFFFDVSIARDLCHLIYQVVKDGRIP